MKLMGAIAAAAGLKSATYTDWPWTGTPPPPSWLTSNGVGSEQAVGLPAWLAVLKRLTDAAGQCPLLVYRGEPEERDRARETWQWALLHDVPTEEGTSFTFQADVVASYTAAGNVYLRKLKARGRVRELMVLDPRKVAPERRTGRIEYRDTTDGSVTYRTSAEIIHVRGPALHGELTGLNPIAALRRSLQAGLEMQAYVQAYYANAARPDGYLKFPEKVAQEMAEAVLARWNAYHQGSDNAGKTAALGGGAEYATVPPISMKDAAFVEAYRLSLQQIAGLYGVPSSFVGDVSDAEGSSWEQDAIHFKTFGVGPIMTALERKLSTDPDLCPPASGLFVEHLPEGLTRPDTATRFTAYREGRQGGFMTANEIRARENLPPHRDGDVLQVTPVGGAENPGQPSDAGTPPDDPTAAPPPTEEDTGDA